MANSLIVNRFRRMGEPGEIAALAPDQASFVTVSHHPADGGYTAQ